MKHEREIDLRDLLYYVLRKWRVIIVVGLLIALLAGASTFISGIANNSPEVVIDSDENDAARMKLADEVKDLQKKFDDQKEYNENSVLMKTNALKKYVASFVLYIDSNYQIDPNLSYQNPDKTDSLASTYAAYLQSEELYAYVFDNTDCNSDIDGQSVYLSEMIVVTRTEASPTITVACSGDSAKRVAQISDAVKKGIEAKSPEMKAAFGDHTCKILMESEYSVVDTVLRDTQEKNLKLADEYELSLTVKSEQLETLGEPVQYKPAQSTKQIVVKAIKSAIVGGVFGVVVAAAVYFVKALQTRKMWSDASWDSFEIPVLSEAAAEKKKVRFAKFDRWIEKITGRGTTDATPEEAGALAAANVSAMLKQKESSRTMLISTSDKKLCNDFLAGIKNSCADAFSFAGNILTEPEAVSALENVEQVVLLAEGEKISVDEVRQIQTLLTAWGKKLLGVILIK